VPYITINLPRLVIGTQLLSVHKNQTPACMRVRRLSGAQLLSEVLRYKVFYMSKCTAFYRAAWNADAV